MVGVGILMLAVGVWSLMARFAGGLGNARRLHWAALAMGPSGFLAVLAGWITTEVGRQPYTVYGLLRTADSVSPISSGAVATSLIFFIIAYFLIFGSGTFYILRLMAVGPAASTAGPDPSLPQHASGLALGSVIDDDAGAGERRS